MEPYLAQIILFGGNFAPRGWAFCNGQLLSIAQNTALFSLLGTTFGGDGQTTFGLPDLRGRVPIHHGQGPGLSNYVMGEAGGQESVTLLLNQMPSHTHAVAHAAPEPEVGTANLLAGDAVLGPDVTQTSVTGGNQPHENMPPYLGVNYIIALEGIYPSRS